MQIISLTTILDFLPILLSFVAFVSMVYHTLKMFRNRRAFRRMSVWRHLLHVFVPDGCDDGGLASRPDGRRASPRQSLNVGVVDSRSSSSVTNPSVTNSAYYANAPTMDSSSTPSTPFNTAPSSNDLAAQ